MSDDFANTFLGSLFDFNNNGTIDFGEGLAMGTAFTMAMAMINEDSIANEAGKDPDEIDVDDVYATHTDPRRSAARGRVPYGRDGEPSTADDGGDDDSDDWFDEHYAFAGIGRSWGPNATDVAAAQRLRDHLSNEQEAVEPSSRTCYDCAFWRGDHPTTTRAWGCHVYYAIAIEYGGSMPDVAPSEDSKVCKHFAFGIGRETTCFDCVHWPADASGARREHCAIWEKVLDDNSELHSIARRRFGQGVSFVEFDSDSPATDNDICTNFALRADGALVTRVKRLQSRVVGIAYNDRAAVWDAYIEVGDSDDLELRREPDNQYDPNAVAVYVGGDHGGYIPKDKAKDLAAMLDGGWQSRVLDCSASRRRKKNGQPYYVATVTIELVHRPEALRVGPNADGAGPSRVWPRAEGSRDNPGPQPDGPLREEALRRAAQSLPAHVYPVTQEVLDAFDLPRDEMAAYLKSLKKRNSNA